MDLEKADLAQQCQTFKIVTDQKAITSSSSLGIRNAIGNIKYPLVILTTLLWICYKAAQIYGLFSFYDSSNDVPLVLPYGTFVGFQTHTINCWLGK